MKKVVFSLTFVLLSSCYDEPEKLETEFLAGCYSDTDRMSQQVFSMDKSFINIEGTDQKFEYELNMTNLGLRISTDLQLHTIESKFHFETDLLGRLLTVENSDINPMIWIFSDTENEFIGFKKMRDC